MLVQQKPAGDFYAFLQNFYTVFTQYQRHRLFVTGESYAGYYVSAIARRIHVETEKILQMSSSSSSRTKKRASFLHHATVNTVGAPWNVDSSTAIPINLAGIALGNGWIDARVQGPITIDYAYWHGMIDAYTRDNLKQEWQNCITSSASDPAEPPPFHKFNIPDDCAIMEGVLQAAGAGVFKKQIWGPNTYDVTTWDNYPVIQDGGTSEERFLNDPRVKAALHTPMNHTWHSCIAGAGRRRLNMDTTGYLEQDRPTTVVPYIAELLEAGKRVLIYSGDRDMSTCAQGSEALLNNMDWSGSVDQQWIKAPRGLWVVNDSEVGGYAKTFKGLSYVVVYNSGHMVPFNQPEHALDLILRFIQNKSFSDYPLPNFGNITARVPHAAKTSPITKGGGTIVSESTVANTSLPYDIVAVVILATALVSFCGGYWVAAAYGPRGRRHPQRIGYQSIGEAAVELE